MWDIWPIREEYLFGTEDKYPISIMGEHGAMSCTARVYVAGHSLPIKEKNIYTEYFSFFHFRFWWQRQWGRSGKCWKGGNEASGPLGKSQEGTFVFWCDLWNRFSECIILFFWWSQTKKVTSASRQRFGSIDFFFKIVLLGNLGRVDFINDYEYDLFVRPDTCNPRYR